MNPSDDPRRVSPPRKIIHLFPGGFAHHLKNMVRWFSKLELGAGVEQVMAIHGPKEDELVLLDGRTVIAIPGGVIGLVRFLLRNRRERMLVHSVFYRFFWYVIPFVAPRGITIVSWGPDIVPRTDLLGIPQMLVRRYCMKRLRIRSMCIPEREMLVREYNATKTGDFIVYFAGHPEDRLKVGGDLTGIMVGNSAWESSGHLEVFEMLARLKDSGVRIVCPLGYPTKSEYKTRVIAVGRELFGEAFEPHELMDLEEYWRMVDGCGAFVICSRNMQGLGNVYFMLANGRKLYLPKEADVSRHLKELGFVVHDVEEIRTATRDSLLLQDPGELERNRELYLKHFSEDACKAMWIQECSIWP